MTTFIREVEALANRCQLSTLRPKMVEFVQGVVQLAGEHKCLMLSAGAEGIQVSSEEETTLIRFPDRLNGKLILRYLCPRLASYIRKENGEKANLYGDKYQARIPDCNGQLKKVTVEFENTMRNQWIKIEEMQER